MEIAFEQTVKFICLGSQVAKRTISSSTDDVALRAKHGREPQPIFPAASLARVPRVATPGRIIGVLRGDEPCALASVE